MARDKVERVQRAFQQYRSYRKQQTPTDRAAKSTAIATWVIATLTFVIIVVGFWQYRIFSRQLDVMEEDQRPWIKIDELKPAEKGLEFWPVGVGILPLHVTVRNVGHTPGFNVRIIFSLLGRLEAGELQQVETKTCDSADTFPPTPMMANSTSYIRVIFPGDVEPMDGQGVAIDPDDIKKLAGPDGRFPLWFYGCIRYSFGDFTKPHQTGFAYSVSHLIDAQTPSGKAQDVSFTPGENIPPERILFEETPMTAGTIN